MVANTIKILHLHLRYCTVVTVFLVHLLYCTSIIIATTWQPTIVPEWLRPCLVVASCSELYEEDEDSHIKGVWPVSRSKQLTLMVEIDHVQ